MASITERKGRFLARVRREGFPTAAKTFTRRADAVAWARRTEADMESGRWQRTAEARPTLKEAIEQYRTVVASKLKGAVTYRYRLDEFSKSAFAAKPIDQVTPSDLAAWRDAQQARGLKPATILRKLAILSSVLSWSTKERGWISVNPAALVRKPQAPEGRSRTLSQDEVDGLMFAARHSSAPWLAPALTVLMWSAMRRGELFSLRVADVDFASATALLRDTKNGSSRRVPLCQRSLLALRELVDAAQSRKDHTLLPLGAVGSITTRFRVTVARAQRRYFADCLAFGRESDPGFLANLRLHDLRHHAVTTWASSGALSLMELMAISGHKTPRMLARYTHLQASQIAGKLATLSSTDRPYIGSHK
jgi:integrase